MNILSQQIIAHHAKQLRTPMFNQYHDIIRQMDHEQGYEEFLISLMKLELDT